MHFKCWDGISQNKVSNDVEIFSTKKSLFQLPQTFSIHTVDNIRQDFCQSFVSSNLFQPSSSRRLPS